MSHAARADVPLIRNNFGSVGLIDMPSARMAPDGELASGASFFTNNQHYNLTFQALPWLETGFRYSGLQKFDSNFNVYFDRSFAVKARLWDEGDIVPAVAIGLNDLVGTGFFSGEYLVASKQVGDFDFTLGLGWGRLASANKVRNPLALIRSSFDNRPGINGNAGAFSFSTYFHGHDAGVFGGVAWKTPIENLTAVAEYSSDEYTLESARGNFTPQRQLNLGLTYRAFSVATLGLNWLYGNRIGANISFDFNPVADPYPVRLSNIEPPLVHIRTAEEQQHAINALLAARNPRSAALGTMPISDKNMLVDQLWSNGFTDIAVSGNTLQITIVAGDPHGVCEAAGRLAARYAAGLAFVLVKQPHATPVRCAVPAAPHGGSLQMVSDTGGVEYRGLVLAPTDFLTIDATAPAPPTPAEASARIRADARKQRIDVETVLMSGAEAAVYYANGHYLHEHEAIDRLVRILLADTPPNIEKFRLISTIGGQPEAEFDILRGPTERNILQSGSYDILADGNAIVDPPMSNPELNRALHGTYPRFSWSIFPQFRQQLFDPSNPFAVQLLAGLQGTMELMPGFSLTGEVEANIYDNFNINRSSDSVLQHVRSDFVKYFTKGKNGIGDLEADYRFRLAPNVFAMARAGILESMFSGVGGEVLWRPDGQRWALGVDAYEVWQRNFDRLFGLQSYHVLTGHVSLYYASPWYDLNFAVSAGRYLAGDKGLTLTISRRFDSGVEIGVFATRTNITSAQFGEGSFDKGIMIRLPLEYAVPISTQSIFGMDLRPVQRDGGQRLVNDTPLYNATRRTSLEEISRHTEFSVPPP